MGNTQRVDHLAAYPSPQDFGYAAHFTAYRLSEHGNPQPEGESADALEAAFNQHADSVSHFGVSQEAMNLAAVDLETAIGQSPTVYRCIMERLRVEREAIDTALNTALLTSSRPEF